MRRKTFSGPREPRLDPCPNHDRTLCRSKLATAFRMTTPPPSHERRAPTPRLEFSNIVQDFPDPGGKAMLRVLDRVDFAVEQGRFTAIVGPSGCGKSTLLQLAAGLLAPTSGTVRQNGRAVEGLNRS
ncbi:MAG: ATP-binding cassette domain-containing protein, partial [Hyphomicrobiales bacterium]|nr:ATP-binding cassette domain-containing protein [Hyphomicrobiales bacterium]